MGKKSPVTVGVLKFRPVLAVLTLLTVCAGCSSSGAGSASPPGSAGPVLDSSSAVTQGPGPTAPASVASQSPTPSAVLSTQPAEAANLCRLSELTVSLGDVGAAAGTLFYPIVFRNSGRRTCQLQGYPGVAGVNAAGTQMLQANRLRPPEANVGFPPQLLSLTPGVAVSALLTAIDNPQGGASSCPHYALLVTPPGETRSTRLSSASVPNCRGFGINPVVAGVTGQNQPVH
jgi:hypothetical protein